MNTTLRAIRAASPCESDWRKLIRHLGGIEKYGIDAALPVAVVLESNGLNDALWVLANACGAAGERLCHAFMCDVAERVLSLYEATYPGDTRPRAAIETKRRWLAGEVTGEDLAAAWAAARAARYAAGAAGAAGAAWAAWAAAWAAARAARYAAGAAARYALAAAGDDARYAALAAAGDDARDAARAAEDAERAWQTEHLKEMLETKP